MGGRGGTRAKKPMLAHRENSSIIGGLENRKDFADARESAPQTNKRKHKINSELRGLVWGTAPVNRDYFFAPTQRGVVQGAG